MTQKIEESKRLFGLITYQHFNAKFFLDLILNK